MVDTAYYRTLLEGVFQGRPWICTADVLVAAAARGARLLELGADRVLAIAASRGTGEVPESDKLTCIELGLTFTDMMAGLREADAAMGHLPAEVCAQVDAFDPEGVARAIGPLFSCVESVAGRAMYGGPQPNWIALEDKMVVDQLWDAAGVPRAPSEIVSATGDALEAAASRLDRGMGTVWVADNRDGWHGGATMLRWVRTREDARAATAFLESRADRARVMPFLDGIPCSIHGIVFPHVTIALRPCEMLVFRIPGASRLAYAGAATSWDPEPDQREVMRRTAVRVGDHLREHEGYRGTFTVDGVITAEGFLPTELNPRFGAAIGRMTRAKPGEGIADLPLYLLHRAVMEGEDLDFRPRELERLVVDGADANRVISAGYVDEGNFDLPADSFSVIREADGWREARAGEEPDGAISIGPATAGAYVLVSLEPTCILPGASAAPAVTSALAFAADRWGLQVDPMVPAPDLRP